MKLRKLIEELLALAGDLDEEVYVRIITRNDAGSVEDSQTKVALASRVSAGCNRPGPHSVIVVESSEFEPEYR